MPQVAITDATDQADEPLRAPGLRALRKERERAEAAERLLRDLSSRITALEKRHAGADMPRLLAALAGIRSDLAAEQAAIRAEMTALAEGLEQVRAMLAAD